MAIKKIIAKQEESEIDSPHPTDKPLIKSSNLFPVVGIGASAGGLDAFKKLLKAIPENSGMAYVLVQHLDPSHESMLVELLQKVTNIPVLEITDDIRVVPDHIYILPSNKMMIANDGVLELSPRPAKNKNLRNLPIDLFFTSLAEVHQSHAIGVVLSGTASDGTLGLKAIKDHGGITFAQDEASAAYESMPNSAVQAGVVDFILSPEKIPEKLLEVTLIINGHSENDIPQPDEDVYKQMLSLLRIRKGTDFTYYKQSTIRRRILRRMVLNKNEEPSAYLKYLRENKMEQDTLYQDMLIPVTSFFRDLKVFDNLCESVFPQLVKNKTDNEPIRIWVAGCSTGEEVYSVAICLKEFLGNNPEKIQIFATDISEPAIAKARGGLYKKNETLGLTDQRLNDFFTKTNGSYQVNKEVRDMCVFAVHNFLKDPPFGKMDMISCRNVLIYMEPYLQKKALSTFHYALNAKGFLLLGKSETTSGVPDLFALSKTKEGKKDKLFTRKDVPGKFMHTTSQRSEQNFTDQNTNSKGEMIRTDFQKTADDIMLSKYTPAGVVVNEAMDIVHFRGSTGNYLEPSPGKASLNLLKMAKDGLAFELRNILHKAKKENYTVVKENIPVEINKQHHIISIEAIPLPNVVEPHYLILFHEAPCPKLPIPNIKASSKIKKDEANHRIQQLEKELSLAREDMRSITEDQEAANEELQSANEELLSGSEEMQSLNEELETSKEELQSTNEELMVVNQEMINLNEQVTAARDYAEAIVTTIREPLLVLDKNLRVKSANNSFYKAFQAIESEVEGRLIYELGNKQWNIPELRTLLEEVLPQKTKLIDYEVTINLANTGQRIMLLNAREIIAEATSEKLILLAIEDITNRREAELSGILLSTIVESSADAIISKTLEGNITTWNKGAEKIFGYTAKEIVGKHISILIPPDLQHEEEMIIGKIKNGEAVEHYDTQRLAKNGTRLNISVSVSPIKDKHGKVVGASKIVRDITEQIKATKKIEESEYRYHNMIYTSPSLIAIFKGEDMIVDIANDAILESWGRGKDIIGKSLFLVMPEIKEQGFDRLMLDVYKTGELYYAYESPVTLIKNGKAELMHYTFVYQAQRNADGKMEGVAVIANEVTPQVETKNKLIESEKTFRQLAELMPDKVSHADAQGNINYYNQSWLSYTGYSFDEIKDWGWNKIIHRDDLQELTRRWKHSLETGNNFEMELRLKSKTGIYCWHLCRSVAVKDDKENILRWIATTTEIQKIKEEEQRKGEFLKMVSHELKTPVTSIKGYVQLLLSILEEDKGKTALALPLISPLNRIDGQIKRLTRLITEILDLSRIESGKLELQKEVFNLADLVTETVQDITYANTKHSIEIATKFVGLVNADKDRIEQVIINLVNNAIKYSPGNNKVIIKIYDAGKNEVGISVQDFGIGIEQADQEKVFERFYRTVGASEQHFAGFGIGLFIVKEIIVRHGGVITIKSEKGNGSVFTFTLPLFT